MKTLYTINTGNNFMDIIYRPFAIPFLKEHQGLEINNIMDDTLLTKTIENGGVSSMVASLMYSYAMAAQMSGADGILVTCTSVNRATKLIRPFLNIPILNIEEPVAEAALKKGGKIGILGTVPSSPPAMEQAIITKAQEMGKEFDVVKVVAYGAYDCLLKGDRETHDMLIKECLGQLVKEVDVVVFSQISMSLLEHENYSVPIYKIGKSGFESICKMMEKS